MAAKKAKAKPAKKKMKKAAPKAARKTTKARPAPRPKVKAKAAARPAKKARKTARPLARARSAKAVAKRPVAKKAPARKPAVVAKQAKTRPASTPKPSPVKHAPLAPPPTLQRERRRLPEAEAEVFTNATDDSRLMSSARTGHDELRSEMRQHTESSPAMTAGDVDAKWQDAYALGDEAPGGDNMTPDQDRVDDIGKALGIEYADDEELLGGDELAERDEHRWELDPASKDEDEEI